MSDHAAILMSVTLDLQKSVQCSVKVFFCHINKNAIESLVHLMNAVDWDELESELASSPDLIFAGLLELFNIALPEKLSHSKKLPHTVVYMGLATTKRENAYL